MTEKEWWQEPGMEAEIDGAAWDLQVLAESLPSRWKHIISAASTLVLCANRRDLEGVDQYLKVIAKQVARPRSSHPADGTIEAFEGKKIS